MGLLSSYAQFTGKPLYEVREQKFTIDPTKDLDDITNF